MAKRKNTDLADDPQTNLFGEDDLPAPKIVPYRVFPEHVRQWFYWEIVGYKDMKVWPWEKHKVQGMRATTWPYYCEKLDNPTEAKEWMLQLDAEADRLDAPNGWGSTRPENNSNEQAA